MQLCTIYKPEVSNGRIHRHGHVMNHYRRIYCIRLYKAAALYPCSHYIGHTEISGVKKFIRVKELSQRSKYDET